MQRVSQVTTWLEQHPETSDFLSYLRGKVFKQKMLEKWAHVFHPDLPVRTNNICESFFRVLKDELRTTRRKRLDAAIAFLQSFHDSFFRNLVSKSVVGEVAHKSVQQRAFEEGKGCFCVLLVMLVAGVLHGVVSSCCCRTSNAGGTCC